jgi:hypothetical protein
VAVAVGLVDRVLNSVAVTLDRAKLASHGLIAALFYTPVYLELGIAQKFILHCNAACMYDDHVCLACTAMFSAHIASRTASMHCCLMHVVGYYIILIGLHDRNNTRHALCVASCVLNFV